MFIEIYKEIRKFFRGPVINHHNKPVPPLMKIFMEKASDVRIDSTCFFVQSDDSKRFYIQSINDESEKHFCYTSTILFDGKVTNIVMIPKIVFETDWTVKDVMKTITWTLYQIIPSITLDWEFEKSYEVKKLYMPILYCVLVKNIIKDTVTLDDIYSAYNTFIYNHLQVTVRNDDNRNNEDSYYRFISKEFFKAILEELELFPEVNPVNIDESCEKFIYKYLDCSFITIDKDIMDKYYSAVESKDWEDDK